MTIAEALDHALVEDAPDRNVVDVALELFQADGRSWNDYVRCQVECDDEVATLIEQHCREEIRRLLGEILFRRPA